MKENICCSCQKTTFYGDVKLPKNKKKQMKKVVDILSFIAYNNLRC